jgi:hypothetical protein
MSLRKLEGGLHFQLLSPADRARRFSGEGAVEFASDSAGGFLTGGLSIGVGGSGHLSCPFCEFAGRRTRARVILGRRTFDLFSRFSSDGWRRPTFVQSPPSDLLVGLFGVWRHVARLNLARDEKLESTEKGQAIEKHSASSRTGRMNKFFRDDAWCSSVKTRRAVHKI